MADIVKFWSSMKLGDKIHPADKEVFDRIDPQKHGFRTDCLPACYLGRIYSAPIVLLYLSPGFSEQDVQDAKTEVGKNYYLRVWAGHEPLPENGPAAVWLKRRTKNFANFQTIRDQVAILNIGAYHSKDVKSYSSLLALPSSRASLDWAQNVLFHDAEKGRRVVICMRSAGYWGLEAGQVYGKSLFVPKVTRSGYLVNNEDNDNLISTIHQVL